MVRVKAWWVCYSFCGVEREGGREKLCVEQNNKKSRKMTMKKRMAKRVDEKK